MARIFDFRWRDENTPQFLLCSSEGLQEKDVSFGKTLTLSISEGLKCVGYLRNETWNPCPYERVGMRKCPDCKQKEGISVAQFCDGENLDLFEAGDLEKLNTPHYLYLALFQEDLVKVGVSAMSRGHLRQLEQGTHFALIVFEGMGGILARQIEKFLVKCGIPDKILASQKKEFLFPDISEKEGKQILLNVFEKYRPALLQNRPEVKKFIKDPFQFVNFETFYHLSEAKLSKKPLHSISLQKGDTLSGTALMVKGPFLLVETDLERILLNTKDTIGLDVDFSEKPIGLVTEGAFQSALF